MKRLNPFKESNEVSLFHDIKMKDLLMRHFAFSGFDFSTKLIPKEIEDLKITQTDIPCFLIFKNEDKLGTIFVSKISLKNVDSHLKEQQIINELSSIVTKTNGIDKVQNLKEVKPSPYSFKPKHLSKIDPKKANESDSTEPQKAVILKKQKSPETKNSLKIPKYAYFENDLNKMVDSFI